jgi:hypothetical protein
MCIGNQKKYCTRFWRSFAGTRDCTGHEFRLGNAYNSKYGDFSRVTMAEWFEEILVKGKPD